MKCFFDLSRTDIENLINEWIFSARDRNILRRRIFDGLTYEELSEEFHLSTQRVKVIVYQCRDRLYRHI